MEWISVKDQLPQDRVKVVAYRYGVYALAYAEQLKGIEEAFWQNLPAPPSTLNSAPKE